MATEGVKRPPPEEEEEVGSVPKRVRIDGEPPLEVIGITFPADTIAETEFFVMPRAALKPEQLSVLLDNSGSAYLPEIAEKDATEIGRAHV